MPGVLLWGYDLANKVWVPLQVDATGLVKVDMSEINLGDLGDVTIAGLADGHLISYSVGLGYWQNRLLADADIPAAIARDIEVANAIIAHAILTTGIHGLVADNLFNWWRRDVWAFHDFLSVDGFLPLTTGTGSVSNSLWNLLLQTGATINSTALWYLTLSLWNGAEAYCKCYIPFNITSLTDILVWAGFIENHAPGDTANHIAWKVVNARIYCSAANGVTQTIVDTGIDMAPHYVKNFWMDIDCQTSAKFYIEDALVATITTNLPTVNWLEWSYYLKNTAAADKISTMKELLYRRKP